MVRFGGFNPNAMDATWTYDTALPVLNVAVSKDSSPVRKDSPIFYAGDSMRIKITATNTGVNAIEPADGATIVSGLDQTLLAAGTQFLWKPDSQGSVVNTLAECVGTVTTCAKVQDLAASIANLSIPAGKSGVADFVATVAGSQRGCEIVNIPATVSNVFGGTAQVTQHATVNRPGKSGGPVLWLSRLA